MGGASEEPSDPQTVHATANDADDGDSDITGTLSDGERESMEIDALVAAIPKDQRDGVRAMLEKSKIRRARRFQRRLKKPIADEPSIPRNPKK